MRAKRKKDPGRADWLESLGRGLCSCPHCGRLVLVQMGEVCDLPATLTDDELDQIAGEGAAIRQGASLRGRFRHRCPEDLWPTLFVPADMLQPIPAAAAERGSG